MKPIRVICVGANIESRITLEGLIAANCTISAVVTRPRLHAQGISDYADLIGICDKAGIPVIETLKINSPETLRQIQQFAPDYLYVLGWSELFRSELLRIPHHYVVGSHPTPLPKGRGRAPVPWTILQGWTRSAVSLFRMDDGVDSGRLLTQRWFDVPANVYAGELYELVATNLRDAYCDLYAAHAAGKVIEEPVQQEDCATYFGKRTPEDGHLDFRCDAAEIDRLVRAVSRPYPGAYAYYEGVRVTIWRSDIENVPAYVGTPGQILKHENNRLLVQAGDRPLWLHDLAAEGRPLKSADLKVGARFGYRIEDEIWRLRLEIAALKQRWEPS